MDGVVLGSEAEAGKESEAACYDMQDLVGRHFEEGLCTEHIVIADSVWQGVDTAFHHQIFHSNGTSLPCGVES